MSTLRDEIRKQLGIAISSVDAAVTLDVVETLKCDGYQQQLVSYRLADGDEIRAYLLTPTNGGICPGIVVHHQHNSERHLGKSEPCGLAGSQWQHFGPPLAKAGHVVLMPDSICFEDRRQNEAGIASHKDDAMQHYNEMCYRLLSGDTLMRKVLSDSIQAINVLENHSKVSPSCIGLLGHSYGGNTTLFHCAIDERIAFACVSGAACSFDYKMKNAIGIEMAEVLPGFAIEYDIHHLIAAYGSNPILIASAENDPYSADAEMIIEKAENIHSDLSIDHIQSNGGHALNEERFGQIIEWIKRKSLDLMKDAK